MPVKPESARKPDWLKVRAPGGERYTHLKKRLRDLNLHTVCEEARCPNVGECWGGGTATVMLLGEICTRGCRFCAVASGKPTAVDDDEPANVARMVADWGLDYLVLTTVDRDDLPDGGAAHIGKTVSLIKQHAPQILVETLTGDFRGDLEALRLVVEAKPDVVAHNIETVERLTPQVRDRRATYRQSLDVLKHIRLLDPTRYTKSSIMLGLGETEGEVVGALGDLRHVDCDVVTFGQYLQPTPKHLAVVEHVHPDQFEKYRLIALEMGFRYVASGPLVRSSYRAGEYFMTHMIKRGGHDHGNQA